jgi:hypothetical protein
MKLGAFYGAGEERQMLHLDRQHASESRLLKGAGVVLIIGLTIYCVANGGASAILG